MWLHIPEGFRRIDQKLTNGRLSSWISKLAHTLWNDRHPLVMVRIYFFVLLFLVSGAITHVTSLVLLKKVLIRPQVTSIEHLSSMLDSCSCNDTFSTMYFDSLDSGPLEYPLFLSRAETKSCQSLTNFHKSCYESLYAEPIPDILLPAAVCLRIPVPPVSMASAHYLAQSHICLGCHPTVHISLDIGG